MITDGMRVSTFPDQKKEVYRVCQTGKTIYLKKPATKDGFGAPLTEDSLTLKAFPVRFSPFNRKVTQKVAWAENVNVITYISKHAVDLQSLSVEKLKSYKNLVIDGKRYELSYVEHYMPFADDFLYVILGGKLAS